MPAAPLRASAEAAGPRRSVADSMQTSAVYWNDPEGERCAGRVSLGPSFAELDGSTSDGQLRSLRLGFDEIAAVRYPHGGLHLSRRHAAPLRLGSAAGPGALRALAARLKTPLAAVACSG